MPTALQKNVMVRFRWKGGPSFQIVGGSLGSGKNYAVTWQMVSGSAATLKSVDFVNEITPPALQNGWTLPTAPADAIVQGVYNDNTAPGSKVMTFPYTVTVQYKGDSYTSPDPELELQPPRS